jgi:sulfate permease, SulP family
MIRNWPVENEDTNQNDRPADLVRPTPSLMLDGEPDISGNEQSPLIRSSSRPRNRQGYGAIGDVESQRKARPSQNIFTLTYLQGEKARRLLCNPKSWDRHTIWRQGVVYPIGLLPAVLVGLLLNILDALSYGMILFPLGEPIFAHLGSDGISMFYVSTIISQLVYSCGGSVFKGGVGSEMIEVLPFFHTMAFMIQAEVGSDNPKSVLATTILSFAVSSIVTGTVFFLLGACKLGLLIGFFPRHILIGCIGGVGWFLVATAVEVSARLPGSLEYNLPTLRRLFQPDAVALWTVPLLLAIGLMTLKRFIGSRFLVTGYFICVAAIFYMVKFIFHIPLDDLRANGWVFPVPSSSTPWYHFYTLYGENLTQASEV